MMKVTKLPLSAEQQAQEHLDNIDFEYYQVQFTNGTTYMVSKAPLNNSLGIERLLINDNGFSPITVMGIVDIAAHFWGIGAVCTIAADVNKHTHAILHLRELEEVNS